MNELRDRIRDLLAAHSAARASEQEALERAMAERRNRRRRFGAVAARIFQDVIEPRMRLVEASLEDARYERPGGRALRAAIHLNLARKYEAEVTFWIAIRPEHDYERLTVFSRMRVIPRLLEYRHGGHVSMDLSAIDGVALARFVDDEIVQAIGVHLQLRSEAAYRLDRKVTDPVCGMRIDPVDAVATATHDGKSYWFCAVVCRDEFVAGPGRYLLSDPGEDLD